MKQAEIPELTRRIAALSKASSLGARIRQVEVEPGEYAAGAPFLRVYAYVGNDPLNATDPSGLARVEILYRPIAQTAYIASHSYVVVSESDGSNPVVFRARPGNAGTIY